MRLLKPFVLLLLLVMGLGSCEKSLPRANNTLDYIPTNSEHIIKIAHLETTAADFATSSLFKQLSQPILYDFLTTEADFIKQLQPVGESVLCFQNTADSLPDYTFITHVHPNVFLLDSTFRGTSEKIQYESFEINKTSFGNRSNFSVNVDSMFVASSSEAIVKEIIDNKTTQNAALKKAYALDTKDGLVHLFQPSNIIINDSLTINLASQTAVEILNYSNGISGSGVLLDRDTIPQLLQLFHGLQPQQNRAAYVTPTSALEVKAMTFNDAEILEKNLRTYHDDSLVLDPIFGSINELVSITLVEGQAVVLKSIDAAITEPEFKRFTSEIGTFRDITIFELSDAVGLFNPFQPFVDPMEANFAFQWEEFFVFTETEAAAQQLITDYTNNATLAQTNYFENTSTELSDSSSFLVYSMQGTIGPWMAPFLMASGGSAKKFPLAAMQVSYDRDFAHVNLVCKEIAQQQESTGVVTQLFTHQLDATILGEPQFFSNHRTRGKDIVVQDIQNQLYLISSSGKRLWKKKLDGPILGEIQEVDLLRNGKKQLAFTTPSTFYILDRNGNNVAPFPKKFKDEITQPLSVFDYDNKRKYRFIITQGKSVLMYDRDGKTVKGFTFKKASSDLVMAPQHIRMGNKDYLLLAESNGKLNILSRVGKERVKVNKTFDFSEIAIMREGQNFVVIDTDENKHSITQSGNVSSEKATTSDNYSFLTRGNTKVTLDDNLLRINGKLVELPFGIYNNPSMNVSNRKTYVMVTDVQEKKVYLFNKSGVLQKGFPIYGSGTSELADAQNNDKNALVVKGNENEVILYRLD